MPFLEDIDTFSNDFQNVLAIIKDIETKKKRVVENLARLKIQYAEMVKSNTKKIFVFCLDSFFYQYKMYSVELEQIENSRKMVNNRMFCEYYKLFGIIVAYFNEANLSYENKQALLKKCPTYKDLEPLFEYDIDDVENIYNNTTILIRHLYEQTLKNTADIENYQQSTKLGFSISNFVNTLRNDNLILQGQIDLFMNYMSFFLASQKKQYSRISERIANFLDELDEKSAGPVAVAETIASEEKEEDQPIENEIQTEVLNQGPESSSPDMSFE